MTHEEFIEKYLHPEYNTTNNWHIKNDILYVDGHLTFNIPEKLVLPDNLTIKHYLGIQLTNITELPRGLVIGAGLWARSSKLISLPEDLIVKNSIDLAFTQVQKLPENMNVGGRIFSSRQLFMSEKIQKYIISKNDHNFYIIKNPTKSVKALQNLLWEI